MDNLIVKYSSLLSATTRSAVWKLGVVMGWVFVCNSVDEMIKWSPHHRQPGRRLRGRLRRGQLRAGSSWQRLQILWVAMCFRWLRMFLRLWLCFFPFFQATNAFLSLSIAMGRGTARTTATRLRSCSQWQYNERSVRLTWELGWLQTSRDRGVSPSDNQRRPELHVHHQLHRGGRAPASGDSYSPWSWYWRCCWWCWLPWPAGCVASELGSRAGEVFDDEHLAGGEQGLWGAYMSHGKVIWDNIVSLAGVPHHISVFLVNNDR